MQNETYFSTRDIYLASTLLTLKFSLAGIDFQIDGMKNKKIGFFNFLDTPELAEVEQKFWGRRIAIEPVEFIKNLYLLKSEVTNSTYREPRMDATDRDIYFAATLLTLKFNLEKINFKVDGYRQQLIGFFEFENTPQLEKVKEEYLDKKLVIEPLLFVSNLRGLKSRVTNVFKSPHTKFDKYI